MIEDREQSPAGSQMKAEDSELEIDQRGPEPYWIKAGRIVDDMRGLLDRIEATAEPGTMTHPYERVIGWLEEDLGQAEIFELFDMVMLEAENDERDDGGEDSTAAA